MPLQPGARLGSYEIVAPLGAGGMGEVYRARDTRLRRDVAVKVLPELVAADPDRLARFQREAQVLASLNHPNIGAIHGFEESQGTGALVLELVEGPTLDERLRQGPMPIEDVIPLARQITDALEAAHNRGIIHRDLKPANIKVRPDGTVKVLDFGLAKALDESAGADLPIAATRTSPALTHAGIILGTAAYMAPEQAKGKAVDARADIWAFGCVLFEMLTGAMPFDGDSVSEVIASVLKSDPQWRALPAETPDALRRLIRRCLQKDPARRLQHIGDARLELDDAASPSDAVDVRSTPALWHGRERIAWGLAGALGLAAVALGVKAFTTPAPAAPEMRLDMATAPTADPFAFAISPDGKKVVFMARSGGREQLWLRAIDSTTAEPLPATDFATFPFWSPDSRSIGFFADSKVKRFALDSRSVSVITSRAGAPQGGAWHADGTVVFAPHMSNVLRRVDASGANLVPVTRLDNARSGHRFPHLLPGGQRFLYYVVGTPEARGIYAASLDGATTPRIVDADTPAVYSPTGHLLYVTGGRLLAHAFDATTSSVRGAPFVVAENVAWESALPAVSISAAGTIVYRSGPASGPRQQLTIVDRSGKELDRIATPSGVRIWSPAVSRDGRHVALHRSVEGNTDIWWLDTSRRILTRLTSNPTADIHPLWSPDGSEVIYASRPTGVYDLFRRAVTGDAKESLVLATAAVKRPVDWSADGSYLLYVDRASEEKNGPDIWALPLKGDRKPFPVLNSEFDEMHAQFSPDGRWICYESNKTGRGEIFVRSFPSAGKEWQVSTEGGSQARWRPDGGELFFIGYDRRLMAAPVRPVSGGLDIGTAAALFDTRVGPAVQTASLPLYSVLPDGKRFLMLTVLDDDVSPPFAVLLNWKPKS